MPVCGPLAQVAHALSSLATMSTGNGEHAGGSVEMGELPSQQHAASAPAAMPPAAGAAPHADGLAAARRGGGQEAVSPVPLAAALRAPQAAAHPAASAPAAVPPQQAPGQPGGLGPPVAHAARPAASASMSGQGDTPGTVTLNGGAAGPALPQSSAAVALPAPAAQHPAYAQQAQGAEPAASHPPHAGAMPALASLCMGQNDGGEPMADARSRRERGGGTGFAAAPARAAMEGMGSPDASMHVAQPRESQGTARATILAGATHSILTTAAAGATRGRRLRAGAACLGREGRVLP